MKVLEVGCGAGRVTIPVAQAVPQGSVLGVDLQAGMIRQLERRTKRMSLPNLSWHQRDVIRDGLPSGPFDRIVVVTVLGEIPAYTKVLQDAFDQLRPGGMVSITEVLPDPCYIPSKRLRHECESLGFQHLETIHNLVSYTLNLEKPRS